MHLPFPTGAEGEADPALVTKLEAAINNQEWLDRMSAPRIEHGKKGDKGLMGKVRGRERERLRRKKNEEMKRTANDAKTQSGEGAGADAGAAATATGPFVDSGDEDDGDKSKHSSEEETEESDVEAAEAVDVKDERNVIDVSDEDVEMVGGGQDVRRTKGKGDESAQPITIDD